MLVHFYSSITSHHRCFDIVISIHKHIPFHFPFFPFISLLYIPALYIYSLGFSEKGREIWNFMHIWKFFKPTPFHRKILGSRNEQTVERIEIIVKPSLLSSPLHYKFISSTGDPLLTTDGQWNWEEFFKFRVQVNLFRPRIVETKKLSFNSLIPYYVYYVYSDEKKKKVNKISMILE